MLQHLPREMHAAILRRCRRADLGVLRLTCRTLAESVRLTVARLFTKEFEGWSLLRFPNVKVAGPAAATHPSGAVGVWAALHLQRASRAGHWHCRYSAVGDGGCLRRSRWIAKTCPASADCLGKVKPGTQPLSPHRVVQSCIAARVHTSNQPIKVPLLLPFRGPACTSGGCFDSAAAGVEGTGGFGHGVSFWHAAAGALLSLL